MSTGAQQADSALGGFEAILDALISEVQADQADKENQGNASSGEQSPDAPVDSSQNSKQVGNQFSPFSNKDSLGSNVAASTAGDRATKADLAGAVESGSDVHRGVKRKEDTQPEKASPSNGSSFGTIDSFVIATAASQIPQPSIVQASSVSTAGDAAFGVSTEKAALDGSGGSPAFSSFNSSLASTAIPANSTTAAPQGVSTDIKNLLGSTGDSSKTVNNESPKNGIRPEDRVDSSNAGVQRVVSESHASEASKKLTKTLPPASQSQTGSNSTLALREQMKKALEQGPAIASSVEDQDSPQVDNSGLSVASGRIVGAATLGVISDQTAIIADPTTQSASITRQEPSVVRTANGKKDDEPAALRPASEVANFASATRTEFQPVAAGPTDRVAASGGGVQGGTNPFGALDSAPTASEQQAQLLRASHRQVEVGVQDPQYGWVEVKTQMNAGQVVASLSVNSVAAQHALQQELPAMQHFAASRDLNLSHLSVSTGAESGAGAFHQGSGQEAGNQQQPYSQIPSGQVWGAQPSSSVSSTAATENVWMPETASRISVLA